MWNYVAYCYCLDATYVSFFHIYLLILLDIFSNLVSSSSPVNKRFMEGGRYGLIIQELFFIFVRQFVVLNKQTIHCKLIVSETYWQNLQYIHSPWYQTDISLHIERFLFVLSPTTFYLFYVSRLYVDTFIQHIHTNYAIDAFNT